MEEVLTPCRQKYQKVEQKIEQLAQSKLQNLSDTTLRHTQDKIDRLEKRVADQLTAQDNKTRQYRLKLTSFRNNAQEIQQKLMTSLRQRSSQIASLKQQIDKALHAQSQERSEKEVFCQQNCQEKMEKLEKELLRLKIDKKEQLESINQHISEAIQKHQETLATAGSALDQMLTSKMDNVYWNCGGLREAVDQEYQKGEKGQKEIMDFLRGVVSQMKGMLSQQKLQREKNRDKLRLMIQSATHNLALEQ